MTSFIEDGEKWHEHHADPTLDLTLISNDGVLFKASSYYLAKASTVFEGMTTTADHASRDPISIDTPSTVLSVFLDMVYLASPLQPNTDVNDTLLLLDLCKKFDCSAMEQTVYQRLGSLAERQHWDIFAAASYRENVEMAKIALGQVTSLAHRNPFEILQLASKRYAFAFLHRIYCNCTTDVKSLTTAIVTESPDRSTFEYNNAVEPLDPHREL